MHGQPAGNNGHDGLIRIAGLQETLSLDARGRFRMPDALVGAFRDKLSALASDSRLYGPTPVGRRLAFYFVPAPAQRIFIYPTPNIHLAIDSFENPPLELEPEAIRGARDYFYARMSFVESDTQNRFVIPQGLRDHAGIDEATKQITIVAQNYWLALSRAELVEQRIRSNLERFERAGDDLLDPLRRRLPEGPEDRPPLEGQPF